MQPIWPYYLVRFGICLSFILVHISSLLQGQLPQGLRVWNDQQFCHLLVEFGQRVLINALEWGYQLYEVTTWRHGLYIILKRSPPAEFEMSNTFLSSSFWSNLVGVIKCFGMSILFIWPTWSLCLEIRLKHDRCNLMTS